MKNLCKWLTAVGLLVLSSCASGPRPGDIVSERVFTFAGKRFVEQRIILTTEPYETELRTIQIRGR